MLKIITIIFLIALLAVGASFTTLNAGTVELNYYFGSSELPLALAIVIAIGVGAAFGLLGSFSVLLKCRREVSKLKRAVKSSEQELSQLKTLSAKDA